MSLKNTLLESSSQKTRSPIFPCPYSRASSSQVQLHLDTRFLGNSNSPLIRTKSDSLGFTSYIYCKFNFKNPKPRSQQCFVAPFLCISPVIPVTASDFMPCLSEIQSPNALRASIFSSCAVPYLVCVSYRCSVYFRPKEDVKIEMFLWNAEWLNLECNTNYYMTRILCANVGKDTIKIRASLK